jgi:hypothetical protein
VLPVPTPAGWRLGVDESAPPSFPAQCLNTVSRWAFSTIHRCGRPACHVFVGSKAPWFEITDDLPQYAEYAPPG